MKYLVLIVLMIVIFSGCVRNRSEVELFYETAYSQRISETAFYIVVSEYIISNGMTLEEFNTWLLIDRNQGFNSAPKHFKAIMIRR